MHVRKFWFNSQISLGFFKVSTNNNNNNNRSKNKNDST